MNAFKTTSLAEIKPALGDTAYRRLARRLGGVKTFGKDTRISILEIARRLGVWEAMDLLRCAEWPAVNPARLLAADLAAIALPVYERHRPWCAAASQAVNTAREFARGETGKAMLGHAHRTIQRVGDGLVIAREYSPPERDVARAAAAASDPFGAPGEMVWQAWSKASVALTLDRGGYLDAVSTAIDIMNANEAAFEALAPHFEEHAHWLAMYRARVDGAAKQAIAEHMQMDPRAAERAFLAVLLEHLDSDGGGA